MKRKTLATAMLACIAAPAFCYEPFSYTYVEAGAWEQSGDGFEADGYRVNGSLGIDGVVLQLGFADGSADELAGIDLDELGADLDYTAYSAGVGGYGQPNERTSVWGGVRYTREDYEASAGGLSADADGYVLSFGGGVRYWLINMLEINGGLQYVYANSDDLNVSESDIQLNIGARFQPISMLSIGVGYARALDAEADAISLDARLQF